MVGNEVSGLRMIFSGISMKTYKHLWEEFISKENFELAYRNSTKGKSKQETVQEFKKNAEERLEKIRQKVIGGQFHTSPYREKVIYEPKKRTIYMLPYDPDRIVQHAVMNVLKPILTKKITENSFSCIENRGQISASRKCSEMVRKYDWCLKCDIHKFYPSISQKLMSQKLHRIIRDEKFMAVVDDIIFSYPGDFNIPIGNYTSQWFGNYFLSELDTFVLHTIKPGGYIRYCDDFMLFDNDKQKLLRAREEIEDFLWYELLLEYSKADLIRTKVQGVDFCGYRHFKRYSLLRKSTAKRLKRRYTGIYRDLLGGKPIDDTMRGRVASGHGLLKHACTHHLQQTLEHDTLLFLMEINPRHYKKGKNAHETVDSERRNRVFRAG